MVPNGSFRAVSQHRTHDAPEQGRGGGCSGCCGTCRSGTDFGTPHADAPAPTGCGGGIPALERTKGD